MPDEPPEAVNQEGADPAPTAEVAEPEAPALTDEQTALLAVFEAELGDGVVEHADALGTLVVRIRPDAWRRSAEVAKTKLHCDYLSFVSGIDWQPMVAPGSDDEGGSDTSAPVQPTETTYGVAGSTGRFQVFAHVQSTSKHHGVTLKTDVDDDVPSAESWTTVYPGADWHERECAEMFGIGFEGHPNLRKLYLPAEFEGHPLRKDFALLAREEKPWPGHVDDEPMPGEDAPGDDTPAEVEEAGA
jgi:NADH-quinone oxidoreductase subunit C